jgi:hypothetical protein
MAVNRAFSLVSRPVGVPARDNFTGDHLGRRVVRAEEE